MFLREFIWQIYLVDVDIPAHFWRDWISRTKSYKIPISKYSFQRAEYYHTILGNFARVAGLRPYLKPLGNGYIGKIMLVRDLLRNAIAKVAAKSALWDTWCPKNVLFHSGTLSITPRFLIFVYGNKLYVEQAGSYGAGSSMVAHDIL